jgi:hypothetical protein
MATRFVNDAGAGPERVRPSGWNWALHLALCIDGVVAIMAAQLGYLLEGIDWRMPQHTWHPQAAG